MTGQSPQDYAENVLKMKESKEGFTLIKQAVGFHNPAMMRAMPNGWYDEPRTGAPHSDRGLLTERGLKEIIACVESDEEGFRTTKSGSPLTAVEVGPSRMPSRLRGRSNRFT